MSVLLTDNLISYWPLDESSGNAIDAHGANDLTISSGDTISAGDGGRVLEIGNTEYFSRADNADLSCYGTSFTLRIKVKLTSKPATAMYLVNKFRTTATAQREYTIFWGGSGADLFNVNVGTPTGTSQAALPASTFGAPTIGVWYNITMWYDHSDSVLAVQVDDGVPNRATQATSPMDGTSDFFIGALSNPTPSLYADATIKDVGLWKRVLSPAEIEWLNNSGTSRTYAEIAAADHIENPWQMILVNKIWTWFNSPEATTHLNTLWVGAFPSSGELPKVGEVNLLTRAVTDNSINQAVGQTDDHDNPAIIRLASGYLLAVFSFHNGDCWSARSTNKNDATAWETAVKIEDTLQIAYAQIMQADDGTIYDFCRRNDGADDYPQVFFTSDDEGATWSTNTEFLSEPLERPYFRWWKTSGTRFDFFCTTGQPGEAVNSLYHGYIRINANTGARTYYQSDGTLIGDDTDLPLSLNDLTLVYDGTTSECWIWDAKVIGTRPVAVFAVFPSHATTAHEYHQARWTGSAWTTEKICDAGTTGTADYLYAAQEHYSGGVAQDPNDIDKVYVSREFSASDFRVHAVEQIDNVWTVTDWLSEYLTYQINARPRTVSARGQTQVLWWGGTYASFSNYNTNVYLHPDHLTPAISGRTTSGTQRFTQGVIQQQIQQYITSQS